MRRAAIIVSTKYYIIDRIKNTAVLLVVVVVCCCGCGDTVQRTRVVHTKSRGEQQARILVVTALVAGRFTSNCGKVYFSDSHTSSSS